MPFFERDGARLYYEIHGDGFPLLLLAPGGMRSTISFWERMPLNLITHLAPRYRVIAMDQRNAGQSTAPVRATDGWDSYRDDQLGLLDHLGVDTFHVAGMCIGGSFIMGLAQVAAARMASAVMLQPIGHADNRDLFFDLFDGWAEELKPQHPDVQQSTWDTFRDAMFAGDFLFNLGEDAVTACPVPLLVLMGNDRAHPEETSRAVARLAPDATLIERWKDPEHLAAAGVAVDRFLERHTP